MSAPPATLPDVLPVFPLTGVLLLPGQLLPLHVFEPRYRNLVEDVLAGERHLGMIQPRIPRQDDAPLPGAESETPVLHEIGCAGRLARCAHTRAGTYLIVLRGVGRFRILEELPQRRGYRRVAADYSAYAADLLEPAEDLDPGPLLAALETHREQLGLKYDADELRKVQGPALVNLMATALPFHPDEKQALLEAAGIEERYQALLTLLQMGIQPLDLSEPPVTH